MDSASRLLLISLVATLFVSASGAKEQKWPQFRTTFGVNPWYSHNFAHQPRTMKEAEKEGWIDLEASCKSDKFAGLRMIRSAKDIDMVLIFDKTGYIAGIQNAVPVAKTMNDQYYNFSGQPMYVRDTIQGADVYLTTAYFVDPESICKEGRTEEQFAEEGTGNALYFQNGPNFKKENLLISPLTEAEAKEDPIWFEHLCFVNMGKHYFPMNYDPNFDCYNLKPYQLLFKNGLLKGFVFQHVAKLGGSRFEVVTSRAIDYIVKDPPKCLKPLTKTPGISTMHVYFKSFWDSCW